MSVNRTPSMVTNVDVLLRTNGAELLFIHRGERQRKRERQLIRHISRHVAVTAHCHEQLFVSVVSSSEQLSFRANLRVLMSRCGGGQSHRDQARSHSNQPVRRAAPVRRADQSNPPSKFAFAHWPKIPSGRRRRARKADAEWLETRELIVKYRPAVFLNKLGAHYGAQLSARLVRLKYKLRNDCRVIWWI